ncbi:hypothetical protein EJ06DRAFT_513546 [Trichodelitschia bisporula]|uniref:Homoserine dehydrogenase n=1 Tax=Trichodelitschia bisporula TaxID=703511 RepID=A0A6G1HRW6_9PEZI|nr:hypothetical protein EJ06DRAFT_513546 [Trichodelitschia bisporula]
MPPRQVNIAVIGTGGVGTAFISQLETLSKRLASAPSPTSLNLVLLARSTKMLFNDFTPLSFTNWTSTLSSSTTPTPSPSDLASLLSKSKDPIILVDNTSSQELADTYPLILQKGIHIATASKKAFSARTTWNAIQSASANNGHTGGGYIYHESSVGAGLPILTTIHDLVDTGDRVTKIEGVFSGTMSFLFNSFQPVPGAGTGVPFSAAVREAKEKGYTEPDPRDDLNGLDVARKLTILARLVGVDVESPTSFEVQSLIPKELESAGSADEFLARLPEYDGKMKAYETTAKAMGGVVRYVGKIDVAKGEVRCLLEIFKVDHPIAALKGSDNIVSIYTERYGANPLIIQGAGAGAEVTAMGVTADVLRILRALH